jgi:threonine dehydrogenase-like Zn-dependent dehydrogenase
MGIVNTIGRVCKAIIDGVVTVIDVIISCLTCGYCGRRRRMTRGTTTRRSRV